MRVYVCACVRVCVCVCVFVCAHFARTFLLSVRLSFWKHAKYSPEELGHGSACDNAVESDHVPFVDLLVHGYFAEHRSVVLFRYPTGIPRSTT